MLFIISVSFKSYFFLFVPPYIYGSLIYASQILLDGFLKVFAVVFVFIARIWNTAYAILVTVTFLHVRVSEVVHRRNLARVSCTSPFAPCFLTVGEEGQILLCNNTFQFFSTSSASFHFTVMILGAA